MGIVMDKKIALLCVAFTVSGSQLPLDAAETTKPLSQAMAGPAIATQLNELYGRRFPNCHKQDSQPAFLCSGVTLRVTLKDPANTYKVWDPSPASVASGAVAFSYLRADSNFGARAWGMNNGIILYPIFESPADKLDVDYLCAYPMDAWTSNRTAPCARHASYDPQSRVCQEAKITTAAQWKAAWDSRPTSTRNVQSCGFDVRDDRNAQAGPAFYQFVQAKTLLGAQGFNEQNELLVKTWPSGQPNSLPLMAFFYLADGTQNALADARYNQQDFYKSTHPRIVVPIIRLTLPTSPSGTAIFTYVPSDQVVTADNP